MPKITIYGIPVGMAAMKCVGGSGKVRHQLVTSNQKELKPWQAKVAAAAHAAAAAGHGPYTGPVSLTLTVTNPRPPSVSLKARQWPTTRSSSDIDHHVRSVADGLVAGGIVADDSLICHLEVWQCYPDTPGVPDQLPRPGVVVRIDEIPIGE